MIILIIIFIYILYYFFETSIHEHDHKNNLEKDGFSILYNPEYCLSSKIPSAQFKNDILNQLPPGYNSTFLPYASFRSALRRICVP